MYRIVGPLFYCPAVTTSIVGRYRSLVSYIGILDSNKLTLLCCSLG